MSLQSRYHIKCPFCGHILEANLWDSVNATINPELIRAVLEDEFNVAVCPYCDQGFFVEKEVLFNFDFLNLMIFVVPEGVVHERYKRQLEEETTPFKERLKGIIEEGFSYEVVSWKDFKTYLRALISLSSVTEENVDQIFPFIEKAASKWPDSLVKELGTNGADEVGGVKGVWLWLDTDSPELPEMIFVGDEQLYEKTIKLTEGDRTLNKKSTLT